ncbi:MAG TPA: alkaline phosphatase family protein [Candidatus Eisenbacteria bacterium]|jgi:acid phosphatase
MCKLPSLYLLLFGAAFSPTISAAAGPPALDHVIVVVMENHTYDQVRTASYTASLIRNYTSFSKSYALTHPSQPNYLALWAATTQGVTNDNCPAPGSPYTDENLGHAIQVAGKRWKAYSENLPSAGSTACTASSSLYTRKHDPWTNYSNCNHAWEVPYGQLATDIAAGTLPDLAFVIPNNCDNTHDCSVSTGDAWLASNLPSMISAVGPRGLVILTWDEDDKNHGNHILTVFAGPVVKTNYVSSTTITHYTLVRTICDALGIGAFANAATESGVSDVWNTTTDVPPAVVAGARLGEPRPNPFRGSVSATLELEDASWIEAAIYDLEGRRVRWLVSGTRQGAVEVQWDGTRDDGGAAPGGLYFLRVEVAGAVLERRLVRVR